MYSAAIKRRVLDMACHGVSYYEIERTLGVSRATVSKWARAAGIKRGKGGSHTWDNVKVACGECNCVVKGAKVLAS